MGSCLSRGKGSHPNPNHAHKRKQELSLETKMGAAVQLVSSNGNTTTVAEPPPSLAGTTCIIVERRPSYRQHHHHHNHQQQQQTTTQANNTVVVALLTTPTVTQQQQQQQHHKIVRAGSEQQRSQQPRTQAVADSKIAALFEAYCEPQENVIMADGIERLCADLDLSPDEFRVLLLAWKMNAGQMCRFTRDEFVGGCRAMRVDTLRGIQTKLVELTDDVTNDAETFKDLYRFTFRFGLDPAQNQRILPAEMAIVLWRLVFSVAEPPILERWLRFLECHHSQVRGVPRDTWNMFLNFAEAVGDDLSSYDDAEAWPSLFDDFVEFENDQANQNISKEKGRVIADEQQH